MHSSGWARTVAGVCSLLAALTGVVSMVGWLAGVPGLTDWFDTSIGMQFNTALVALMSGVAVLLSLPGSGWGRWAARIVGAAVSLVSAATLSQHLLGVDLGIDTLLHTPTFKQTATAAPGRMGPPAGVSFILVGLGAVLVTFRGSLVRHLAGWTGLFVVLISMLSLVGYLYGASAMYSIPKLTGIAAQTAVSIMGLGTALMITAGVHGPGHLWNHQGAAGLLVRRVLPAAVLLPVIIGWLRLQGQKAGWYDSAFGAALRTIVEFLLVGGLLWIAARAIAARESAMKAAEVELATYRDSLEYMVQDRTQQLEASSRSLRDAERMASLGTLTAGLGHDLHNALLPLRVHAEELSTISERVPEVRPNAEAVSSIVAYLTSLSRGMRMISRDPDQDTGEHVTDFREWTPDAARVLQSLGGRGVDIQVSVEENCPNVPVAPHQLMQAIFNLVQNSLHAIQESHGAAGTGHIEVRVTCDGGPGWVDIVVEDNGGGMTEEVRRRCVEPFYTTRSRAAGRTGGGTGMGLALVQSLVVGAGGTLHIDSRQGAGTRVHLRFPAAAASSSARPGPLACVEVKESRVAALTRSLLLSQGFKVESCGTDPKNTRLWVTDSASTTPETVARLLELREPPLVVVLGVRPGHQFPRDSRVLIRPHGEPLSALRRVLADAAHSARGPSTASSSRGRASPSHDGAG